MDRLNGEGIPRNQLEWALTQRKMVLTARKINSCLLCCSKPVNEGGICDVCMAILNDKELKLVERWMGGTGP